MLTVRASSSHRSDRVQNRSTTATSSTSTVAATSTRVTGRLKASAGSVAPCSGGSTAPDGSGAGSPGRCSGAVVDAAPVETACMDRMVSTPARGSESGT